MKKLVFILAISLSVTISFGQTLTGVGGAGKYKGPFERGYQSTDYCGNSPESWVRGSAFLDKRTGLLTMKINLETDATHAGPKGQVLVYVYDADGNKLAQVASAEIGRGGKAPGSAQQSTYSSSFDLGKQVGSESASLTVVANCTGSINRWFNVPFSDVENAFKIFYFKE